MVTAKVKKSRLYSEDVGSQQPAPWDRAETERRVLAAQVAFGKATRESPGFFGTLGARLGLLTTRLNTFRPMRAFQTYSLRHGPLLAAGSAYNMFFSVAAMLVAGFSIFGLIASGNEQLQRSVVNAVAQSTPGLIATDSQPGLAEPEDLFNMSTGLSLALIISVVALLFTSLGWINGLRAGIRAVFGLETLQGNPVLRIVKDLGLLLGLGVALILTSVIGLGASTVLDWLLTQIGLESRSFAILGFVLSLLVTLLLDLIVAFALFRVAADVSMPRAVAWQTALIAAVGSTVLRSLSGILLANVGGQNPLLAPFSVILGLFVWFYLLSQVYLIAAGWGTIGKADTEQQRS
ncbi:YihY/virulence factor BrkB family protein [Acaricomes phytoseiuli]|uniref:YihY/virulence factor BrkB family protein n=1 Tax=Acaricomes phytoseiuli TaxID=291968 RepID=UPI00036618F5|nr:YihY/virulence factor BrkB family protein [Acaricomes phytoseiuli]